MAVPKNLSELVTFVPNKHVPVHNWFYFKEGYAADLVKWLVSEFNLKGPVLDPFCGVGTTLLACKKMGIESMGLDVSPLAVLATKVKTRNYDLKELEKKLSELENWMVEPIERIPLDPKIRKLFYHQALETIWFFKTKIEEIEDEIVRDFFLLALIDTTGSAANVEKVGGSLRKTKKPNYPVQRIFLQKCSAMIRDLESEQKKESEQTKNVKSKFSGRTPNSIEPVVLQQDCRYFKIEAESINAIITSPPYLNKIEYAKVYKLELAVFFGYQTPGLRAYVGDNPKVEPKPELAKLPLIAQAYFTDLNRVLENCFQGLRPDGIMVIVVAGGCLPEGTVNSPQIITKLAGWIGFELVSDYPCRTIQCRSPFGSRIGNTTENVLVFRKPPKKGK